jgi:DNA-directed RNA polymerase subunit RPC12/RpoP
MGNSKFLCHDCHSEILVYYNEKYGGERGKCPKCGHDFPLE